MDWFLYDNGLRLEEVKFESNKITLFDKYHQNHYINAKNHILNSYWIYLHILNYLQILTYIKLFY